jgi:hypothetical protein
MEGRGIHCAICGGTFRAQDPCGDGFWRLYPQAWQRTDESTHTSAGGNEINNLHLSRQEEDCSYDPAIISESDLEWTENWHILGWNPEATGLTKYLLSEPCETSINSTCRAFVSGPVTDVYKNKVEVDNGNDPTLPAKRYFTCYSGYDEEDEVFPFHWCCYEVLCIALTGQDDVQKINKDFLHMAMRELNPFNYGEVKCAQYAFWESELGLEFPVDYPMRTRNMTNSISNTIISTDFHLENLNDERRSRVKEDPFSRLPYDLIHQISCLLPNKALLDLGSASWPVSSALRNNESFWKERINSEMPWFFELHELLEDAAAFGDKSLKRVFVWAEKISTSNSFIRGPFMGIVNRRRIWGMCEQIAAHYVPPCREEEILTRT